ncbi:MarR family winged helix-turn-helix transcriptional regulator [Niallia sp. Krafla_26]|uniref:MarR family winged helix-turn-helix transcriptional regulator n=1 Tax=Niallia sp. Krafla_26 TaxID=3064703 RepID=UPI003D17BF1E
MENNLETLLNSQQYKKLYERMLLPISQKYHVTKIEIEILLFLHRNQSHDTAKDIVELKSYTKSHVSKAIDLLIKSEYIIGRLDTHDRRSVHLKLAPKAQMIVEEAMDMRHQFFDTLYKGLSHEEIQVMNHLVKKIVSNIKEALETEV